jgi:hypothetical protein
VLLIPVIWGASKFLGSLLEELGRGSANAVLSWIGAVARHAQDPGRDRIITFQFTLPDADPTGPLLFGWLETFAG